MADQRAAPRRFPGLRVPIAILAIVVLLASTFVVLGGPGRIDLARLGCVAGDVGGDEGPPVGSFGAESGLPPELLWADGATFAGNPVAGTFLDVDAAPGIALAVGRTEPGAGAWRPLIAVTEDGHRWRQVAVQGAATTDGGIDDVAVGGPGWVAVGTVFLDDRSTTRGAIWWSPDGLTWNRAPPQPVAYIHKVAIGPNGMLALGSGRDGSGVIGSSADGLTWDWRPPVAGNVIFDAVAWATDEWVAAGRILLGGDDALPAIWRSPDGIDWSCRLLPTRPDAPYGWTTAVLPGASTTLVTGAISGGCGPFSSCPAQTAAWVATPDGRWMLLDPAQARPGPATVAPDGSFLTVDGNGLWQSLDGIEWNVVGDPPPLGVADGLAVIRKGIVVVGGNYDAGVQPWVGFLPNEP